MEIKPPYGYHEIVPLTKSHRVLVRQDHTLATTGMHLVSLHNFARLLDRRAALAKPSSASPQPSPH